MNNIDTLLQYKNELTNNLLDTIINHSHTLYHYRDVKEGNELMSNYRNVVFDYDNLDILGSIMETTFDYSFSMLEKGLTELDTTKCQQIIWGGNYFPYLWQNGCKGFVFWY